MIIDENKVDAIALEKIWKDLRSGTDIRESRLPPEEVQDSDRYFEGAVRKITINAYERSAEARQKCLEHHGYRCSACNILLVEIYGELCKDFIHVHHLKPLSDVAEDYEVDPIKDLLPVCPQLPCDYSSNRSSSINRGGTGNDQESSVGRPCDPASCRWFRG